VEFSLNLIDEVAPYAAAMKPNRQYLIGLPLEDTQTIVKAIHSAGMVAVIDHKATDIRDTNDSTFYWAGQEGFDAITYCPFPGNVEEAGKAAHEHGMGLIVLALMSNPEFVTMKNARFANGTTGGSLPGYQFFAQQAAQFGDAIVVGAPSEKNHVTLDEVKLAHQYGGDGMVLCPGIGAQGGLEKSIVQQWGDKSMLNVGRAIMYADKPGPAAKAYQLRFNDVRRIAD